MSLIYSDALGVKQRVACIVMNEGEMHPALEFMSILVPGPKKPLQIGIDDEEIQRISQVNLWELESELPEFDQVYVVLMDDFVVPLSKDKTSKSNKQTVVEWKVHNVIFARTMQEAIKIFESDNGRRTWLPDGVKTERQIGIPRIESNDNKLCRRVAIQLVRKDCLLSQQGFKLLLQTGE